VDQPGSALTQIASAKALLRGQMRQRLAAMTALDRVTQSQAVCDRVRLLEPYRTTVVLLLYRALPREVDVSPLAQEASARAVKVYYPRMDPSGWLRFVRVHAETEWCTTPDRSGSSLSDDCLTTEDAAGAMIIVPGLAFSPSGQRLGRGGGHYDRALASHPIGGQGFRVGVAFERQVLDQVPMAAFDVAMHAVVSPGNTWFSGLPLAGAT
jgi:5-formyltetrahydrofolate cyclo-ligase